MGSLPLQAQSKPMMLNADFWLVPGMRVCLALGHGVTEPLLGGDRLAISVVELTVLTVDVDVPACLHVLVNLHGAALPRPGELLGSTIGERTFCQNHRRAQVFTDAVVGSWLRSALGRSRTGSLPIMRHVSTDHPAITSNPFRWHVTTRSL